MSRPNIGILGIGTCLPDQVRTNDWWPAELVESWRERKTGKLDRPADKGEGRTESERLILEAMAEFRDDPFRGSRERRVMADGELTSTMELAAAKDAIARAGIDPKDIGLVLSTTTVPDYLLIPNACRTHEALGLPHRCFTLQTEGVCNAFHMQLSIAAQMIAGGQSKLALLIQSSGMTRLVLPEDPLSAWFGDGATAVIVGPVAAGYGVLGQVHETYGAYFDGQVAGIPGRPWYEDGRVRAYIERLDVSRALLLETISKSTTLVPAALADAGVASSEIDFYAAHQGFAWFRRVTQRLARLEGARTVDTFPRLASLLGANIPIVLAEGEREGLLAPGDLVATFAGAAGTILSSMVIRWGRG